MTASTDNDLRELKDLINRQFNDLEKRIDSRFNELDKKLEVYQAITGEKFNSINARLDLMQASVNKIPELAEKVGEMKNWKQIAVIVITVTFGSVLGWLLRGGKL